MYVYIHIPMYKLYSIGLYTKRLRGACDHMYINCWLILGEVKSPFISLRLQTVCLSCD